ncbi:Phage minor tail protein [Pantoea sp. AS-PWVM4]|uniref:tail fiber domain-containing protein n=1 Tax=Pantoea sp. AS-PWVM4 TaxID=1332069 RepID=UPI0003AC978D|nr:tail fiber domain-containing protein [Pantoea sp. AS-PWVM4]ERK18625.1 Phage minor tail protein [Pantoea sp. AS-PWVM4]
MSAGTIALTNGSTAVNGTGTTFTTELSPGDFVYVTVGGAPYTLVVASIASDVSLTLSVAFDGPTTSGLSWNAVPASIRVAITQKILNDFAMVARGMIQEKANWQQIYTGTGNITVNLPDGTSFTGPAWNGIATTLAGKAGNGANSDITSLTGLTTALSIAQGGTGAKTASTAWKALLDGRTASTARDDLGLGITNTVNLSSLELYAATPFIDFHYGTSSADYTHRIIASSNTLLNLSSRFVAQAGYASKAGSTGAIDESVSWNFYWNYNSNVALGMFIGTSFIGYVTTQSSSDKGLKKDIEYQANPEAALDEVAQWKIATFKYKARGEYIPESSEKFGFIANDLKIVSPECVEGDGLPEDYDIVADPNNPNAYTLDQVALIAKLTMAVQAQQKLISAQNKAITALEDRIAALEGAGS